MIVRILGEGQFELPDDAADELNRLDADLEASLDKDDATFQAALEALLSRVRALGSPVAADVLESSDIVLPFSDASAADVRELLGDEGLIPG